jgi:hypothetical protein
VAEVEDVAGPAADAGRARSRTSVPSARTASSPQTMSSNLPYLVDACPAERAAANPPTLETVTDDGK